MHGGSQLHSYVAAGAAITITFSNLCVFMLYPLIISTHDHRRLKSGLISLHSSAGPPEVLSVVAPQTVNVCEHFLWLQRRFKQIRSNNCSEDHVIVAFSWTLIHFNAKLVLQMGAKMFVVSMRLGGEKCSRAALRERQNSDF